MKTRTFAKFALALAALVTAVLAMSACGKANQVTAGTSGDGGTPDRPVVQAGPPLDTEFPLTRGDVAMLADSGVSVSFREVSEDSRCKPGQTCIWAGDAVVQLTLAGTPVTVHTNDQFPTQADANGYRVRLAALDTDGKVATLVVTRL
ncbi:hypothetical protein [Actinokineospora enzanensis]|uniref:hypothetical protein n=1 Tax=Actinokineospora enzanensis TaxID=155975 RepID=UPI00037AA573|nr:hypothetical protein [Actinokineospora enzanensis]